jgi:hypothetical protein
LGKTAGDVFCALGPLRQRMPDFKNAPIQVRRALDDSKSEALDAFRGEELLSSLHTSCSAAATGV